MTDGSSRSGRESRARLPAGARKPVEEAPTAVVPEDAADASQRRGATVIQTKTERTMRYMGPLPPPRMLLEFEESIPGTGRAIVEEFQAHSKHG